MQSLLLAWYNLFFFESFIEFGISFCPFSTSDHQRLSGWSLNFEEIGEFKWQIIFGNEANVFTFFLLENVPHFRFVFFSCENHAGEKFYLDHLARNGCATSYLTLPFSSFTVFAQNEIFDIKSTETRIGDFCHLQVDSLL